MGTGRGGGEAGLSLAELKHLVPSPALNSTCNVHDEFECGNGDCIDFSRTCDGVVHCKDKSDEKQSYCSKVPPLAASLEHAHAPPGTPGTCPSCWLCLAKGARTPGCLLASLKCSPSLPEMGLARLPGLQTFSRFGGRLEIGTPGACVVGAAAPKGPAEPRSAAGTARGSLFPNAAWVASSPT